MDRLIKAAIVVAFTITVVFLVMWVLSLVSCASEAEKYLQLKYPSPCEVSTLEETRSHAILEITCPGEKPFTKKVRKR